MQCAVIQMVSTPDVTENLAMAQVLMAQAADNGAELVVLPEYFCGMGMRDTDKLQWCEDWGQGPIQDALAACAARHGVWIVGGTLPVAAPQTGQVYNTCAVWSPQGTCVARYDKMHLFRFSTAQEQYDESVVIAPGHNPVVVEVSDRSGRVWRLGLSVCYDLRFPELYRHYAAQQVDMVVVPSAFTATTGCAHWDVLLRARAIENQCFVLAAAQGGHHVNGRHTWGHSLVLDPWGTCLGLQAQDGPGVVHAVLDWTALQHVRTRLPALEHRIL